MSINIVAISGSLREGSWNTRLLRQAIGAATARQASVTHIDLRELALPIFSEDLEAQGTPAAAARLKASMIAADALLFASPEYNSSMSAALKNAIDWASRPAKGETPLAAFQGKVAGLFSASTGALGGLRGLVHLRAVLGNIGVLVLPEQLALPKAQECFTPEGTLADPGTFRRLEGIVQRVIDVAGRLRTR